MDEKAAIDINVDIEFREYVRYGYAAFYRKTAWFLGLILLIAIIAQFLNSQSDTYRALSVSIMLLVLFAVIVHVLLYFLTKKEWRDSPELFKGVKYSFSPAQIGVSRGDLKTAFTWNLIKKADEFGGFFILYPAQVRAFFFPVRSFANEIEAGEFRKLLKEKLGDKAKLKS